MHSTESQQVMSDIVEMAKKFHELQQVLPSGDDYRPSDVHKDGGFALDDKEVLDKYRSALKDLIKQIGRMLLSGSFELYKVSFPIKAMSPKSILYAVSQCAIYTPVYLTAAAYSKDPIERMKYVIVISLSYIYKAHFFDKPLNPILGETYQARLDDGSEIFLEQVCHHPPISYYLQCGPNNCYRYSAYSSFSPKAHMNSIDLNVVGTKKVEFSDGSSIVFNPNQDKF